MGRLAIRSRTLVAGLCLAIAPGAALAQPQPNIAIPVPPSGALIAPPTFDGCYGITQDLFGPYRMDFCLTQYGGGSYQVSGAALCQGTLNWQLQPGQATVQLNYTNCTNNVAWSPDRLTCTILYVQPTLPPGVDPRVAIPVPPTSGGLQCLYQPSVPGYAPVSVIAERRYYATGAG